MITVACIGTGNWGRNLVRNFYQAPDTELLWCCDTREERLDEMKKNYPGVMVTEDAQAIFADKRVDACVIAASASAHYALAKAALEAGKQVFVEKPLTLSSRESEELVRLADTNDLILMVGHLLLYHPAVDKLKNIIDSGDLGQVYYMYTLRVNLGTIRSDENALWSFAPHDISVILYLLGELPDSVSARGECYLRKDIHDVVFLNLHFASGIMAQIQLSWLDPHKERKLTIVGSDKMVVFNDMEPTEKVKIYDKGARLQAEYESYGDAITLRFGDILIPRINMAEPLKFECQHFLDCIRTGERPRSDGWDGLRVVQVLEAAQRSLDADGAPVPLEEIAGCEVANDARVC